MDNDYKDNEGTNEILEDASPAPEGKMKGRKTTVREVVEYFATIAVTVFFFTFIFALHRVPTESMYPTIKPGSIVVCTRVQYLLGDPAPEYGDVVSFRSDEAGRILIKRVIGLPGDTISFEDGYLIRNGEKVEEPYLNEQGVTQRGNLGTYTVPEGCFFVLGDNRQHSADSRYMSNPYIPFGKIYAKMLFPINPFLIISAAHK